VTTELEFTAYHEAGHAVIGEWLGIRVHQVSFWRNDPCCDRRHHRREDCCWEGVINWEEEDLTRYVPADVVAMIASGAAAERAAGSPPASVRVGSRHDREETYRYLRPSDIPRERFRASRLVRRHWATIAAVAERLLERETLSGREVRAICGPDAAHYADWLASAIK
jgi:hypothetical protein